MRDCQVVTGSIRQEETQRSPIGLILVLGAMSVFGALSINIYIPALPEIGRDLGRSTASIQTTVVTFMIGMATGQCIWGALSERIGRRPPVLIGFLLFIVSTCVCATAQSAEALAIARLFQGFGACAGQVLARTIVSDNFEGPHAAIIFSWQHLIMGMAPIFAPLLGGALLIFFGWRSIFWLLLITSTIFFLALCLRLPESRSQEVADHARGESRLAAYWAVLTNPRAMSYILAGGFGASTLMTWYSGASPLFREGFKWSIERSSLMIALLGISIVFASQLNRSLLKRYAPRQIIVGAMIGGMICLAVSVLVLLARFPGADIVATSGIILGVSSYGFMSANLQALAFGADRLRSGSISALFGTTIYAVGAALAAIISQVPQAHGISMAALMFVELLIARVALQISASKALSRSATG